MVASVNSHNTFNSEAIGKHFKQEFVQEIVVCYFSCRHMVGSCFVGMVHRDVSNLKQVQMG